MLFESSSGWLSLTVGSVFTTGLIVKFVVLALLLSLENRRCKPMPGVVVPLIVDFIANVMSAVQICLVQDRHGDPERTLENVSCT